ncbi:MAG TPA: ABC transporter ATP-binding protein [Ruminiclostridium sp.]
MSDLAIKVEHLSKEYRLGVIGQDTLHKAISSKWARMRGKEDPNSQIGDKLFDSNERFLALEDVSFEVKKGEVLGIIGGNGAGKSTLLKILSQITSPTQGKISISGTMASLLEVGTGFHPELTGRENVYMNGAILGMRKSEINKKYDEIVEFAEIEKFIDTPVKRYSSGMYVRLAFAVAAHLEPDILIVDEVLAVGDAKFQKKCLGKMGDVSKKDGRTVLFVSHNMGAVMDLCDRCLLLENGKNICIGETKKIIDRYLYKTRGSQTYKKWEDKMLAPQNKSIRLDKIYLSDENNNPIYNVSTDEDIYVTIEYQAKDTIEPMAGFTLSIFNGEEKLLFSSINNLEENWYGKLLKSGKYCTYCKIPKHLLNNGTYYIGLNLFSKNYSDFVENRSLLLFEITDSNGLKGDYRGDYGGDFRPRCIWHSERLGE